MKAFMRNGSKGKMSVNGVHVVKDREQWHKKKPLRFHSIKGMGLFDQLSKY
jgi:hypothetical protein